MKCPYCNKEYDDKSEYCPYCGGDNQIVGDNNISSQVKEESTRNVALSGPSVKQIEYDLDRGKYTALFDTNDEYENGVYEEITSLEKVDTKYTIFMYAEMFFALLCGIAVLLLHLEPAVTVLIEFGVIILGFAGMLIIGSKEGNVKKKIVEIEFDYLQYKVKNNGGKIIYYDEKTTVIVFEQGGKEYRLQRYDPTLHSSSHTHHVHHHH